MRSGAWRYTPITLGGAAVVSATAAAIGVGVVVYNNTKVSQELQRTTKGKFLLDLENHFQEHHKATHNLVENHVVRVIARDPKVVEGVSFDFGSDRRTEVAKVRAAMPGLEGPFNFDNRGKVLEYAGFAQLLYQLREKKMLDHDDIDRMYGQTISVLVAHPYVFEKMRQNGFVGLKDLGFDLLQKFAKEGRITGKTRQIAQWNLCRLASERGELDKYKCLCDGVDLKKF